jgi:hypothetical protein
VPDVGRVDGGDPEYATWQELATVQDSGRWQLQLHSCKGHTQIHYGPGSDDYGPFYAYEEQGEDFDGWRDRVHSHERKQEPDSRSAESRSPEPPPAATCTSCCSPARPNQHSARPRSRLAHVGEHRGSPPEPEDGDALLVCDVAGCSS